MIKKFHVLYVGQIALDHVGIDGTPANDRRYASERLSEVFAAARDAADDGRVRFPRVVDRGAPFPAG